MLLLLMVLLGIVLSFTGVIDWQKLLRWAQAHTDHWWVPLLLITLQMLLYSFALPGSAMLLVVAPLYTPLLATLVLATGSTLGALGAYLFARRETLGWSNQVKEHHVFHIMEQKGDFLNLCALRLVPAFPHSVINYGAGILHLPLWPFLISSFIGFSVKAFLYCYAIQGALDSSSLTELIRAETLAPVAILALISALSAYFHNRNRHNL